MQRELDAALVALHPRQQAVIIRHLLGGEPQAALAHDLGVAVGTIASDLNRGLTRLRQRLIRRGITLSALALAAACRAEASVSVPPAISTSPSPQALALSRKVIILMQRQRLLRQCAVAATLLGLLATGGMAVDLTSDPAPVVSPVAPVAPAQPKADLPPNTAIVLRLPDLDRTRARFAQSPYARHGWVWPDSTQQVQKALETTQRVDFGATFSDLRESMILQLAASDQVAATAAWSGLFDNVNQKVTLTAPLRWEVSRPAAAQPATLAADAAVDPALAQKSRVTITLGRSYPPAVNTIAPGLSGPLDSESDLEFIVRLNHALTLKIPYRNEDQRLHDDDHDRPGQPRFYSFNFQFTPSGVRESFRRVPGVAEALRLAKQPFSTIDSSVFFPLGADTLAAIAVADPGATLLTPWLSEPRLWCDARLLAAGLPSLNDLSAQLTGTALLAVREATPFPVLDLDLACSKTLGETALQALDRQGAVNNAGERTLLLGPLSIRVVWVDGHLRATSDPQGFRAPIADAGGFLHSPEILAARTRCGETPARILGFSRSGALWSTAARLLSGMGLPLAREMHQRLAAQAVGGFVRYDTSPAAVAYVAEGLAGGPVGLIGVIGLIQSNGKALDPALWLSSTASTISNF